VIHVLASYLSEGATLLNHRPFAPGLRERLEGLMDSGAMPPAIVALPNCFTRYGGSQYLNSTATGRYEDHLVDEVIPAIDAHFRTLASPENRACIGRSSGGYGALRIAMLRPDTWGAVACMSGDAYFEYVYLPEFPRACDWIRPHGSAEAFLSAWEALPNREGPEVVALNIIAMSACYSPVADDPQRRGAFDLPFDLETGELRVGVWERWLGHDPVRMVSGHADALKALRFLHLECGDADEYHLHHGARVLSARLHDFGVPHKHEEYSGGHRGGSWRFDRVLPAISRAIQP
jgi:enterochelin esterase family protein